MRPCATRAPQSPFFLFEGSRTEQVGERGIRFVFADGKDRELPLIIGLMPILPKHRFDNGRFERTTLEPVVGSGPYVIAEVDAGSRVVLRRNPDYWGRDLPIKRGFDNFDELRFEYFRDENTLFEAFKKGLIDVMRNVTPHVGRRAMISRLCPTAG